MRRFGALGGICLETRELYPSVRRLLVVAREQHDEVSRVLDGLVHLLDEVRGKGDVVVLDEDLVALLGEDVGDLARDGGHRAPTAQEEVVSLCWTGRHECWCPESRIACMASLALSRTSRRIACAVTCGCYSRVGSGGCLPARVSVSHRFQASVS